MAKVREVTRTEDVVTKVQQDATKKVVTRLSEELLQLAHDNGLLRPVRIGHQHIFRPFKWFPWVTRRANLQLYRSHYHYTVDTYLFGIRLWRFYSNSLNDIYESLVVDHGVSIENMRAVRSMIEAVVPEA